MELGKVGLVKLHGLPPRRIGRTFKLQLQVVVGAVSLAIWEFGERLQSKQSILYKVNKLLITHADDSRVSKAMSGVCDSVCVCVCLFVRTINRALVIGDGVPCYGALEIVGLWWLLLL